MLAHNIRGGFWWHGSRDLIYIPSILLLRYRWQERGSLTKWHLIWKMKQRFNSSIWKKKKKNVITDIHWCLLSIYWDQRVEVVAVRWWVVHFSSGNSDTVSPPCLTPIYSRERRFFEICIPRMRLRNNGPDVGPTSLLQMLIREMKKGEERHYYGLGWWGREGRRQKR